MAFARKIIILALWILMLKVAQCDSLRKRENPEVIPLCKLVYKPFQLGFFANISVGTPPQELVLKITESTQNWVGGVPLEGFCDRDMNKEQCSVYEFSGGFNNLTSKTWVLPARPRDRNFVFQSNDYQVGKRYASGIRGTDILRWGPLSIPDASIGLATNYTAIPQLGLSYETLKGWEAERVNNISLPDLGYSIYLRPYDANSSELLFGHIDRAKFVEPMLVFNGTLSQQHGELPISGYSFLDGEEDPITPSSPALGLVKWNDPYLYLPNILFILVTSALGARYNKITDKWLATCYTRRKSISLTFYIGQLSITIPVTDMVAPALDPSGSKFVLPWPPNESACEVFLRNSNPPGSNRPRHDFILGAPFARNAYLYFSLPLYETGIAKAKIDVAESNIAVVPSYPGIRAAVGSGNQPTCPQIIGYTSPSAAASSRIFSGKLALLLAGTVMFI